MDTTPHRRRRAASPAGTGNKQIIFLSRVALQDYARQPAHRSSVFSTRKLTKGCRMELWMCTRVVPVPLVEKKSSTVGVHSSHVVVLIPVRPLAASSQATTNGWNQKIYQDLVRVR